MTRHSYPFSASPRGLAQQITLGGLPEPEIQYTFHPSRRFRFDFAWPQQKIACEYQGGLFIPKGGHQTVSGMRRDWEKFNEAQILGWTVLLFGPDEVRTGNALLVIERAFAGMLQLKAASHFSLDETTHEAGCAVPSTHSQSSKK